MYVWMCMDRDMCIYLFFLCLVIGIDVFHQPGCFAAQVASITGPRGPQPGLLAMLFWSKMSTWNKNQPVAELISGHEFSEDPEFVCYLRLNQVPVVFSM